MLPTEDEEKVPANVTLQEHGMSVCLSAQMRCYGVNRMHFVLSIFSITTSSFENGFDYEKYLPFLI